MNKSLKSCIVYIALCALSLAAAASLTGCAVTTATVTINHTGDANIGIDSSGSSKGDTIKNSGSFGI